MNGSPSNRDGNLHSADLHSALHSALRGANFEGATWPSLIPVPPGWEIRTCDVGCSGTLARVVTSAQGAEVAL